jgi:hypothetical protein
MLRSSPQGRGLVWDETRSRQSLPNDVEELVEGVIRSINGVGISTRKCTTEYCNPNCPRFSLADCLIYAAINSVDVVESSVLDGVQT